MRITPEALEDEFTLTTAATRLDWLSRRDGGQTSLNTAQDLDEDDWSSIKDTGTSLDVSEALELLALGVTPPEAWDDFARAIEEDLDADVLTPDAAASARGLAGTRP